MPDEKPKLRVSKPVAMICAMLVAAAAGAAIVADRALKNEPGPEIRQSTSDSSAPEVTEKAVPAAVTGTAVTKRTEKQTTATSRTTAKTTTATAAFEYPQDINLATRESLDNMNGINRSVAEGILSYQEKAGKIHDLDELLGVYGIAERTLSVIKEHFYVAEADRVTAASKTTAEKATSAVTTTVGTTAPAAVTTAETTVTEIVKVNNNEADAGALARGLGISEELAERVIELRVRIGRFENDLELLYVEGFTKEKLLEIRDKIDI